MALHWLGHVLHPDLFREDVRATVCGIYRLFYSVDRGDAMLDELLP